MPTIGIRITEEERKALDAVSRATERTRTYIIRKALHLYFEEYADYQIALDRLNNKDESILTSEEMRKQLGL